MQEKFIATKEFLSYALRIWEKSAISFIDIRRKQFSAKSPFSRYVMPSSMFICTNGSRGEVVLDNISYRAEGVGIFHGGKGTELSIQPICGELECYMVLYKEREVPFYKKELSGLRKTVNPFRQQYGFLSDNPVFFMEQLRRMYECWKEPTPLHLFYEKTAFYQFVYEIYKELDKGNIHIFQPDLVAMAKRYLDEHYNETISIHSVSAILGISESHLRRSFKKQYGKSPQEYLTNIRLEAAKKLLVNENYPVFSVAAACGFSDEYNFSRYFSKNVGVSPSEFRAKTSNDGSDFNMDYSFLLPYNKESLVSQSKLKEEGVTIMLKRMKNKAVIAAALSVLLLSACQTDTTANSSTEPVQQEAEVQVPEAAEEETRTIKTIMGDVEVPANPKRIVSYYISGDVYAFGIEPIGIDSAYEGAGFADLVSKAEIVNFEEKEEVMALEPDLIILPHDYYYEDMSKIAPTVIVPYSDMSMEEKITFLGEILNQEEKAKEIIEEYKAVIAENKQAVSEAGITDKTVSVFEGGLEGMRVHGPSYIGAPSILYDSLGFRAREKTEKEILEQGESGSTLSLEVLPEYAGDIIVQFIWEGMDDMSTSEVWMSLDAVKNGRLIEIPFSMAHYPDVLSQMNQIEYLADSLLALQAEE